MYETVSTRSGLEGLVYRFEDDKNQVKKGSLNEIIVKTNADKHVKISKSVSSNPICDEKATSHKEIKKIEKFFINLLISIIEEDVYRSSIDYKNSLNR